VIASPPPVPPPIPPSWRTPLKSEPLPEMVSVRPPRLTTEPAVPTRALTVAPALVCETSNVAPAPTRVTEAALATEPLPSRARVAQASIYVVLVSV
jgi:hypothetical protein